MGKPATAGRVGHKPARPSQAQMRWQDCELGALFSFDIPVYLNGGWS